jgi:ribosomal protein S18 acetylase RimI-like enzyme
VSGLSFRRPTEDDYPRVVDVVDDWWGGRRMRAILPRLWFQHFTGSSWIAETDDGDLAGFLVGFVSPDHPDEAYVHMIAADPNLRRHGVGRALYERFFEDMRPRGVRRVKAVTWPGNRISVAFHTRIGFQPTEGAGAQRLYGTSAFADYDGEGEDRVLFSRAI